MNWPDEELNSIVTREDLAHYLVQLAAKIDDGRISVENSTTSAFLDSAGRWTNSMDGFFDNVMKEPVPDLPDWAMIAAIFRAALVYE
ncbi:DUF7660 family protein [Micromonospora humi]|uniref:DUF7660 domain-containing protein n=1 Tax=Micromonospora humi TaxID=745366 RepID=A0A1C5IZH7_9ACTN|nr:hypothetical protein [Micromonospora humi]SCG63349.1 hypothetical protein GA0070213_107339 [Micromonospora humi]